MAGKITARSSKRFPTAILRRQRRYSPPHVLSVKRVPVSGDPIVDLISTSHVEKQNHPLRMHCRRLTRLTNAFSKKFENFKAAVALHYAYYNFVESQHRDSMHASNGRRRRKIPRGRFAIWSRGLKGERTNREIERAC